MQINGWKRTRHDVVHEFEIPEGEAPDLQDSRRSTRMVIRPRKVTIHQVPDSNLATYVCVEGRQVRRDGHLAGVRQILCGKRRYHSEAPAWLNGILDELGLVWLTDATHPVP